VLEHQEERKSQWEAIVSIAGPRRHEDFLALDEALPALAALDARKSKFVELRFFGGMNEDQIAEALRVSSKTV